MQLEEPATRTALPALKRETDSPIRLSDRLITFAQNASPPAAHLPANRHRLPRLVLAPLRGREIASAAGRE